MSGKKIIEGLKQAKSHAELEAEIERLKSELSDATITAFENGQGWLNATAENERLQNDLGDADEALKLLTRENERLRERVEEQQDKLRLWCHDYADANEENKRLRAVLEWLDRRGGLGLDVHARIAAALKGGERGREATPHHDNPSIASTRYERG